MAEEEKKQRGQQIFVILGDPIPLARARLSVRRVWDSQRNEKLIAGINLQHQFENKPLYSGPLHLDVTFFMRMPESPAQRKKVLQGGYHIYRPDLSNLLKYIEDVATKVLYRDDCQIATCFCKKIYDDTNPRTEFTITELSKKGKK